MILVLLLLGSPVAATPPLPTPKILTEIGIDEHLGETVPAELLFRDESGRTVRLGDVLQGTSPTLLVLAWYECPMLCGLVLRGVVDALRRLDPGEANSLRLLTVSFDPGDTPERAAKKRESVLADLQQPAPSWPFLVGDKDAVEALTKAIGFRIRFDEASRQYAHPSAVVMLTPEGRISRYLYGVSYPPKELRLAVIEARAGRAGASLAGLLMTCFRFDPNTRRYGPSLVGFFRAGSTLLLLTVGLSLVHLRRRERAERT